MPTPFTYSSIGVSGYSGYSGYSGTQGAAAASGYSGISGYSGVSGYSGISGYSGAFAGTGTSGYVPRFTGASSLGNSLIQDNGSTVTVNATTSVQGAVNATGIFKYNGTGAGELQFSSTSVTTQSHTISSYYNTGAAFAPLIISAGTITSYVSGSAISTLSSTGLAVTGKTTSTATTASPATSGTTQGGSLRLAASNGTALDFGAYAASPYGQWIQAVDATNLANTYPLILNPNGGNVGIGTSSPAQSLQVSGSASATYALITNTGAGPSNLFLGAGNGVTQMISRDGTTGAVPISFLLGSTETMRLSTTGLAVTGTLSTTSTFVATGFGVNATPTGLGTSPTYSRCLNTSGDFYVGCEGSTAGGFFTGSSAYASILYSPQPIQAIISGVKRAEVNSSGLAVTGAASVTSFTGNNTLGVRIIGSTSTNDYSGIDFSASTQPPRARIGAYYSNSGSYLVLGTSNNYATGITNTAMTIDYNGNVGIGTSSPSAKLTISDTASAKFTLTGGTVQNGMHFNAGNTSGAHAFYVAAGSDLVVGADKGFAILDATSSYAGRLFIDAATGLTTLYAGLSVTGNIVGSAQIRAFSSPGTNGGAFDAYFNGSSYHGIDLQDTNDYSGAYYLVFRNSSAGVTGSVTRNGTSNAVLYNTSSDYRLKNITGSLTDSGAFIDALKPKVGTWKNDGSKFVGFIAHEFAEVSPSSVHGEKDAVDADGKPIYQGMQASSAEVIANLVAELQSVRKRLAALES